jgi:hypothetical protein
VSPAEAMQRAIADACLGVTVAPKNARDLRAFLEARAVHGEDIAAVLAAPRRLVVYRTLVRRRIASVVVRRMPRTRAHLNAACAGRFEADLGRFLDECGPRTHYLRDVPGELFAWAGARWTRDPEVPRYLSDLATHELAAFDVAAFESTDVPHGLADVSLDRGLVMTESARVVHYRWAVHELPEFLDSTDEPVRRDVHLLAYRDSAHVVRWVELTPAAGAIVARLLLGEALGKAVEDVCASTQAAVETDELARLLADLADRGVILGARRS